jgi:hypothetical protein
MLRATTDPSPATRITALELLAARPDWIDETTRRLIEARVLEERAYYSDEILTIMTESDTLADEHTRRFIESIVVDNPDPQRRGCAMAALVSREYWADTRTRELLQSRCDADPISDVRSTALELLLERGSWANDIPRHRLFRFIERVEDDSWQTSELLTLLCHRQDCRSHVRQMIDNGATATLRGAAASIWFASQHADSLADAKGRVLSEDADDLPPYRDPHSPVTAAHLTRVSKRADLSPEQLAQVVSELNAELGWDIRKGKPAGA